MAYQELFLESNKEASLRYELMIERIKKIPAEQSAMEKYQDYFTKTAEFIALTDKVLGQWEGGTLKSRSDKECELSLIHI